MTNKPSNLTRAEHKSPSAKKRRTPARKTVSAKKPSPRKSGDEKASLKKAPKSGKHTTSVQNAVPAVKKTNGANPQPAVRVIRKTPTHLGELRRLARLTAIIPV